MSDKQDDLIARLNRLIADRIESQDARIEALQAENERLKAEIAQAKRDAERLMRFAARILNASRQFMSDVDGGDVQAFGVEAGLLVPFVADGPCWEECECDVASDFPLTCDDRQASGRAAARLPSGAQSRRARAYRHLVQTGGRPRDTSVCAGAGEAR